MKRKAKRAGIVQLGEKKVMERLHCGISMLKEGLYRKGKSYLTNVQYIYQLSGCRN